MIDFEELPFVQVFFIVLGMILVVFFACNYTAYFQAY
jgi:hypothetical protein